MNFSLSNTEQKLVEEFRFVARKLLRPHAIEADQLGTVPEALLCRAETLNLMHSSVPRECGGGWLSLEDGKTRYDLFGSAVLRVLASEEGGYGDAALFVSMPGANLAAPAVQACASNQVKQAFLSDFTGQTPRWGAFALTEPHAGSDMAAISTTAQKQKAGYVLNGTKAFIGNGTRAHWTVVIATINPKLGIFGLRPFLVRQGLPGFTVAKHLCSFGLRALAICELLFQECRIPEESLLQPDQHQGNQHGFAASQTVFRHFRPVVAALAIGTARASIEQVEELARQNGAAHTLAHESHRIRSRIDLMKMKLHAARLLCWRAAWLSDHGMVTALDISMAKLQGTKAARETCRECMEIAGRAAAGDTLILEKLFRDMSALELMEGTGEMHRLIIARGFPSDPTVEPAAKENRVTL